MVFVWCWFIRNGRSTRRGWVSVLPWFSGCNNHLHFDCAKLSYYNEKKKSDNEFKGRKITDRKEMIMTEVKLRLLNTN
jgi:hypothetical protein